MKFLHMADLHLDAPFTVLNSKNNMGEKRRLEQRMAFRKIIEHIKENNIEYLFISGDLYENEYVRETTIKYINDLFKEISQTKIYISPGNHDPYLLNSMYKNFKWNDNVKIFNSNVEIVENEDIDIYGFGFSDFYCKNSGIEDIKIKNIDKINILITHGSLEGGSQEDFEYNPLNRNKLEKLGFDYIALGHIHNPDYNTENGQRIVYPGSTISFGFDELGKHGVIVGEIDKEKINIEFLQIDKREFKELSLDISTIYSCEELIEKINKIELEDNIFYKIILAGYRNFEIDIHYLCQFITKENIIKIKNETKRSIDAEKISQEVNLKGLFVKEILEDLRNNEIEEEIANRIIELGLENLNK